MTDRAPKRSYISMRAYNGDIFSYSTRLENDFVTVGELSAVAGANAGNCPQGRILTESGRKLYPGANPGITQLMVSVFDYATGLSGFIDPNSAAFTPQNTDRPYYFTSPGANTSSDPQPDRAPPVFTRGDLLAQGNMDLSGSAHIYGDALIGGDMDLSGAAHIYGAVVGERQVRSSTLTVYNNAIGSVTIDPRKGQVHRIEATGNINNIFDVITGIGGITTEAETQANVGSLLYIIIHNTLPVIGSAPANDIIVDFNASFKSQSAGNYTLNAGTYNTFSFVCDGSYYYMLAPAAGGVSV